MESLTRRRLQALARQLSTGAATPQAVTAPPDGHGNMEQQQHAPPERRLSEHEVAAFVRDGFCLVAVDQFTAAWHEAVHAKAHAISEETGHNQNVLWERLTPEINAVIRSRPVRGALHSLLGGDYLFSGGGHCHVAGPADQTHHKDGTSKGVREHEPRDVIVMYYAAETTVQMGATCVCPGTQYLAVDREGWYNSEERLPLHDACGRARRTGAALTGADSLSRWRAASAKAQLGTPPLATQGTADTTARQARLVEGLSSSLGLHPPRERRMVVPAGSLLVMHRDVFHRGGRAWPGATWRPMFKMGASRVSDPLPASASTSSVVPPLSAATTASALCAARANAWEWLHGLPAQPPVARPAARLPHPAAAVLQGAATEVERIEAAYLLASEGQVSVLLESLLSGGREACCRAACYGLRSTVRRGGAAADVAVATLVPRLAGSFVMAYGAVSGTPAILHCLGHATPALRTVQGLAALLPRLLGEIAALTTAQPLSRRRRWEKQGLLASRYQSEVAVEWGVADRRRAVAEACSALGGQGVGAIRSGDAALAVLVAEALASIADLAQDPGLAFPSFLGHSVCRTEAATALLRMCSDARVVSPSCPPRREVPVDWQNPGPRFNAVESIVAEAARRIAIVCEATTGTGRGSLGITPAQTRAWRAVRDTLATMEVGFDASHSIYIDL